MTTGRHDYIARNQPTANCHQAGRCLSTRGSHMRCGAVAAAGRRVSGAAACPSAPLRIAATLLLARLLRHNFGSTAAGVKLARSCQLCGGGGGGGMARAQ